MTRQEEALVEKALSAPNPTQTIGAACRKIIKDRIDCMESVDRELRFLVKDIVEASNFGCVVKLDEKVQTKIAKTSKSSMSKGLIWGSISAVAIIGYMITGDSIMRDLCGLAAVAGAFLAGHAIVPSRAVSVETKTAKLVAVTTVKEIGVQIDQFTSALMSLFGYRQLEGSHKDFLRWIQTLYADTDSQGLRSSINRLLKKFNYTLEDYSDVKFDCFEISNANVAAPITSLPTLVGADGRMVLKGRYIMPIR